MLKRSESEKKWNWRRARLERVRPPIVKGQSIVDAGTGMHLTADSTPGGWDIEFMTPAPFAEDDTAGFRAAVRSMSAMGQLLHNGRASRKIPLTRIANAHLGTIAQGFDDIYVVPDPRGMMASPQVTGGFRLDQIATMMENIGTASQKTEPRTGKVYGAEQDLHSVVMSGDQGPITLGGSRAKTTHAAVLLDLQAHDNSITAAEAAPLEGMLALAVAYLVKGSQPDGNNRGAVLQSQGKKKYSIGKGLGLSKKEIDAYIAHPQAMTLAKAISPLQSRTDFAGLFGALPVKIRTALTQLAAADATWWPNKVLAGAGLADGKVYGHGFFTDEGDFVDYPLTRAEWLAAMLSGSDLLTYAIPAADPGQPNARVDPLRPERQQLYKSMGLLRNRTDTVGPDDVAGAIIELRRMGADVPVARWETLAMAIFQWIGQINDPAANVDLPNTNAPDEEDVPV